MLDWGKSNISRVYYTLEDSSGGMCLRLNFNFNLIIFQKGIYEL